MRRVHGARRRRARERCLIPVCQVEGQSIRTVESLGRPDALNTLQEKFLHGGGAQCGICTPAC